MNTFIKTDINTKLERYKQEFFIEKLTFTWSWVIIGVAVSICLPLFVIFFVFQQYKIIIQMGQVLLPVMSLPFWFPLTSVIIVRVIDELIQKFNLKVIKKNESQNFTIEFKKLEIHNKRAVFNTLVLFAISILLSLILWYAHLSRPTFSDFDQFVETELNLPKRNATRQVDLLFFTLHRVTTAKNEHQVFLGYFGRFTPYLNIDFSKDRNWGNGDELPAILFKTRK